MNLGRMHPPEFLVWVGVTLGATVLAVTARNAARHRGRARTPAPWALALPWLVIAATLVAFPLLDGHPTAQLNDPARPAAYRLWGAVFFLGFPLAALQTLGALAATLVAVGVRRFRADVPSWLAVAAANAVTALALLTNAPDA